MGMRLENVRVSGFRSLRNSELQGLKVLNCLIGHNNSGKSALLDALLLLRLIGGADEHLQEVPSPVPPEMGLDEWLEDSITDHDLSRPVRLELDFLPAEDQMEYFGRLVAGGDAGGVRPELALHYALELRRSEPHWTNTRLYCVEMAVSSGNDRLRLLYPRGETPNGPDAGDFYGALPDYVVGAWLVGQTPPREQIALGTVADGLIGEALAGRGRDELRWLVRWATGLRHVRRDRHIDHTVRLNESTTLRPDGTNLARFLQHLATNQTLRMRQLVTVFKGLVPWVEDVFTPILDDRTTTRVATNQTQEVDDAFALSNMGSGAIHVMIIAAMIWSMPDGGLALVEEPEIGLHATAQRELLRFLREHCRATGKQVIFATHAPLFARADTDMASFVTLYEPSGGTTFRSLQAGGHGAVLGELGARMSDYFGYNAILLIEGETEEAALPPILDALQIDLETAGIGLMVLRGSVPDRLTRTKEVVAMLAGTQTAPFILVDADPGVPEKLIQLEQQQVISRENWWTWKRQDGGHGEFEDNFAADELVAAANRVAQDAGQEMSLEASEFEKRVKESPAEKTSRVLSRYYWDTYAAGLSKPRLGHFLGQAAAEVIRSGDAERERRYQFEEALGRLLALLPK